MSMVINRGSIRQRHENSRRAKKTRCFSTIKTRVQLSCQRPSRGKRIAATALRRYKVHPRRNPPMSAERTRACVKHENASVSRRTSALQSRRRVYDFSSGGRYQSIELPDNYEIPSSTSIKIVRFVRVVFCCSHHSKIQINCVMCIFLAAIYLFF